MGKSKPTNGHVCNRAQLGEIVCVQQQQHQICRGQKENNSKGSSGPQATHIIEGQVILLRTKQFLSRSSEFDAPYRCARTCPRIASESGDERANTRDLTELRKSSTVGSWSRTRLRLSHCPSWFHRVLRCRREVRGAAKRGAKRVRPRPRRAAHRHHSGPRRRPEAPLRARIVRSVKIRLVRSRSWCGRRF
jgi:hypothetical protein